MYPSPNIVRVIKSRRLRWGGHVARIEEGRNALSNAGGSLTTGRASLAGQVDGDDSDKKRYPGLPGWGMDVGFDNSTP